MISFEREGFAALRSKRLEPQLLINMAFSGLSSLALASQMTRTMLLNRRVPKQNVIDDIASVLSCEKNERRTAK